MRVSASLVGVLASSAAAFSSSECDGTCSHPHGSGRAELPHENQDSACVLSDCGYSDSDSDSDSDKENDSDSDGDSERDGDSGNV